MKPDRERAVLQALSETNVAATYVIRNMVDSVWHSTPKGVQIGPRMWPWAATPAVLRVCKKLESEGRVERVASPYAVMITWAITEAGRQALKDMEGKP